MRAPCVTPYLQLVRLLRSHGLVLSSALELRGPLDVVAMMASLRAEPAAGEGRGQH